MTCVNKYFKNQRKKLINNIGLTSYLMAFRNLASAIFKLRDTKIF